MKLNRVLHSHFLIIVTIIGFLVCAGISHLMQDQEALLRGSFQPQAYEQGAKIDPQVSRFLTFGHSLTVADWALIRALLDPSLERVPKGTYSQPFYLYDFASDLDPAFFGLYFAGSSLLAVARHDGLGARDLLEKGERFLKEELPQYPNAFKDRFWGRPWLIPFNLAYVFLFELDDLPRAASAFGEAAVMPGSPRYLTHFKERLEKPGGKYEVGLGLISFLRKGAKDDRVREELDRKLRDLQVAKYIFDIQLQFNSLKRSSISGKDPWGGALYLNEQGQVATTTFYESVFGLKEH